MKKLCEDKEMRREKGLNDKTNCKSLLVKTAEDFALATEGIAIEVIYVSLKDISKLNEEIGLSEIVKKSRKINDIKKQHFFKVESKKQGKNSIKTIVNANISPLSS